MLYTAQQEPEVRPVLDALAGMDPDKRSIVAAIATAAMLGMRLQSQIDKRPGVEATAPPGA